MNAVTRKQYAWPLPSVADGCTGAEYKNGQIEEEERMTVGEYRMHKWAEYRIHSG